MPYRSALFLMQIMCRFNAHFSLEVQINFLSLVQYRLGKTVTLIDFILWVYNFVYRVSSKIIPANIHKICNLNNKSSLKIFDTFTQLKSSLNLQLICLKKVLFRHSIWCFFDALVLMLLTKFFTKLRSSPTPHKILALNACLCI